MSAQSPQDDGLGRREFFRRTGAAATATAAIGAGASQVPRFSPVGRAQAIAPVVVAGGILAAGAVAGYAVSEWQDPNIDVDSDDVVEDQIYHAASSVEQGREEFKAQMQTEFLDASTTPYERTAWQEIRAAAVREITNGNGESAALSAAQKACDDQTTRSIINVTERWNTAVNALIEQMVLQADEGAQVIYVDVGLDTDDYIGSVQKSDFELSIDDLTPVESSASGDGYVVWQTPLTPPTNPESLEGRDEPLNLLMPAFLNSNDDFGYVSAPVNKGIHDLEPILGITSDDEEGIDYGDVYAEHSSLEEFLLIEPRFYSDVFESIQSTYQSIQNSLSDYISSLNSGIQQGAIDPSDILSSNDIAEEFANSDEQSRLAAELLAIGAQVPDSAGFQAEISHPDLQTDSLWGMVFPQFSGDPVPVTPGTTITSDQYNMAYFGYEGQADGSWQTEALSGDSDLEILDVSGVEGQEAMDQASDTAGTNGRVVVYSGDSPPDALASPADHSGWQVVVQGETTRHVAAVGDVTETDGEHALETTDLPEGEAVEYVELVPSVEYSRSVEHVADPTNPDTEATLERMENLRTQVDELKEALDDGGGGPGDWIGGDGAGGVLAGAVAVIVAIFGLGQLFN